MSYNTRQRELILDYIKKNAKKHLTADDIADALKAEQVGKTTVYRYLESSANRISSGNSFSAREKAPAINITMNSNVTIIFI